MKVREALDLVTFLTGLLNSRLCVIIMQNQKDTLNSYQVLKMQKFLPTTCYKFNLVHTHIIFYQRSDRWLTKATLLRNLSNTNDELTQTKWTKQNLNTYVVRVSLTSVYFNLQLCAQKLGLMCFYVQKLLAIFTQIGQLSTDRTTPRNDTNSSHKRCYTNRKLIEMYLKISKGHYSDGACLTARLLWCNGLFTITWLSHRID